MNNDELYDHALDAVKDLFGDTSVPVEVTRERLARLQEEIAMMIEALEA